MVDRWEQLVNWPAPEMQIRRKLPIWKWSFFVGAFLVLDPAPTTRRPVFVQVIRDETEKQPNSLDEIPMLRVELCSPWSGETVIPNCLVLRTTAEIETRKVVEIPEDWTKPVGYTPILLGQEGIPLSILSRTPAAAKRMLAPTPDKEPEIKDLPKVPLIDAAKPSHILPPTPVKPGKFGTIKLIHKMSKQVREIPVLGIFDHLVRVEWPMSGLYELSKKSGGWRSSPTSLMKLWSIDPESDKYLDEKIIEER